MSQSHELQLHIGKLSEIRGILNAMKNLALIETHKLARILPLHKQSLVAIEQTAADFLKFYPSPSSGDLEGGPIYIVLGSERGFCGDFNEQLLAQLPASGPIVAVGARLGGKLADHAAATLIAGANVAEEVPSVADRLLDGLTATAFQPDMKLLAIYHDSQTNQAQRRQLLPLPPQPDIAPPVLGYPPLLNMPPEDFFADLLSHYLFTTLHDLLYQSLAAENRRRLQHLEGAVNHLDSEMLKLKRKSQIYRQEEITEEIEVILLNAEEN